MQVMSPYDQILGHMRICKFRKKYTPDFRMQVVLSGDQFRNQCKWRHLVAKFASNASGAHLVEQFGTKGDYVAQI